MYQNKSKWECPQAQAQAQAQARTQTCLVLKVAISMESLHQLRFEVFF